MFLTAQEILAAEDLKYDTVTMPEWPDKEGNPGIVRIRMLSGEESIALTREVSQRPDDGMFLMALRCACDADGQPIFKDEDLPGLKKKCMPALDRLQRAALRLNRATDESAAQLKKPLGEAAPDASPIDLPKS